MAKKTLPRTMYEEVLTMKPTELVYSACIPMTPISKKNHQQILINRKTGRPFVSQSSAYMTYEKDAGFFLRKLPKPIDYPVNIQFIFYRGRDGVVDQSNLISAALDILVKYKIIEDDNFHIVIGHDGSRVLIDRDNPRTEISIYRMEAENVWC